MVWEKRTGRVEDKMQKLIELDKLKAITYNKVLPIEPNAFARVREYLEGTKPMNTAVSESGDLFYAYIAGFVKLSKEESMLSLARGLDASIVENLEAMVGTEKRPMIH